MSSSYGWTDEQIGELTVGRLLQITAAIRRREFWEDRRTRSLASWTTRTLAVMIAGGYMTDEKNGNPALDMALKLAVDDIDAAQLEDAEAMHKSKPTVKENSYEKIMSAFGGKLAPPTS